jgi:hypothetical protein
MKTLYRITSIWSDGDTTIDVVATELGPIAAGRLLEGKFGEPLRAIEVEELCSLNEVVNLNAGDWESK